MYWLPCVLRVTTHADPHKWLKDNCAVDKTCWFWKGLCLLYTLGHFAWSLFKKKKKNKNICLWTICCCSFKCRQEFCLKDFSGVAAQWIFSPQVTDRALTCSHPRAEPVCIHTAGQLHSTGHMIQFSHENPNHTVLSFGSYQHKKNIFHPISFLESNNAIQICV